MPFFSSFSHVLGGGISYSLCTCGFLLQSLSAVSPHHCKSCEEIVPELNHFVSLLLDVGSVAVVGDFDHCCRCWWLQESFLELDLLEEELVSLMWWQRVLLLNCQEVCCGDRLAWVGDEVLDELGGSCGS